MFEYKIAVLGSEGVGKSALTVQFVQGIFVDKYDPTIEDTYKRLFEVDNRRVVLDIVDSAGTEQLSMMRDMYIRDCLGFVLVYSIASVSSLSAIYELRQQIKRLKIGEDKVPMVLVGNKCDLDDEERKVSRKQGALVANDFDGCAFMESSAKDDYNVNEIFVNLVHQINEKYQVKHTGAPRLRCWRRLCSLI